MNLVRFTLALASLMFFGGIANGDTIPIFPDEIPGTTTVSVTSPNGQYFGGTYEVLLTADYLASVGCPLVEGLPTCHADVGDIATYAFVANDRTATRAVMQVRAGEGVNPDNIDVTDNLVGINNEGHWIGTGRENLSAEFFVYSTFSLDNVYPWRYAEGAVNQAISRPGFFDFNGPTILHPSAINNEDQVVGSFFTNAFAPGINTEGDFLFLDNGSAYVNFTLDGHTYTEFRQLPSGNHAPIPEPGSGILLLSGLAVAAGFMKTRNLI